MGLFDKFKKKAEIKQEEIPTTKCDAQQAKAPSSSMVWLPEIYKQFKNLSNIDNVYGEKIPSLITKYKSLYHEKAPEEDVHKAFVDLMNEVIRTLYVVPFHYDNANEFQDDTIIHLSESIWRRQTGAYCFIHNQRYSGIHLCC